LGDLDPESIITPGIFVQRVFSLENLIAAKAPEEPMQKLTRDEMAQRVARDIPEGAYVNLGIGLPTRIANYLPADKEIFLHSENGLLGMGPKPLPGKKIRS
jgi:acyl CoA:acetate/3-ketoacid CoA transferase